MEIYSQNIYVGQLKIELSVEDDSAMFHLQDAKGYDSEEMRYHVFLTARDKHSHKVWTTPVMTEDGLVKSYSSVNKAVEDARKKIGNEYNK